MNAPKRKTKCSPEPIRDASFITTEWTNQMLSHKLDQPITVLEWSSKRPSKKEGFLSEIVFVDLIFEDVAKNSLHKKFVFKFLPTDENLRKFMSLGDLEQREINFYKCSLDSSFRSVLDKGLPHAIPDVYYRDKNEDALTIVMEDLTTFGYKTVIVKEGSNLQQTNATLKSMAVIHAAGIHYIRTVQRSCNIKSKYNNDFYDQFLIPNLKTLADIFKGEELSSIFLDLLPYTKEMRVDKYRNPFLETVIHGDLWAGQCLYSEDESMACVLDWQFCEIGNPVVDILSMFGMSTNPDVFEAHLDEILTAYWKKFVETLENVGEKIYVKYEQLKENLEKNWLSSFLYIAISLHDFQDGGIISERRIKNLMYFYHKKNVFTNFLTKVKM